MGKYMGVIIGAVIVFIGLAGLICWWPDLITVLKGSLPAVFILAGAIAVIAGFSEIKDSLSAEKSEKK